MKTTVFLMLLTLLNTITIAKDKLSTTKKNEQSKASINNNLDLKSAQMNLAGLGSYYYEGFDEYTVGDFLAVVDENWGTWSDIPGSDEDGLITDEQALSEPNSVKVEGSTDLILPLGENITGTYLLNFNVFVPSGNVGYFNISHFDTPDIDFAIHCYFNENGEGIFTASCNNIFFAYNKNEWVNLNFNIDLDNDRAVFSINSSQIYSWQWSDLAEGGTGTKQLGFIDFYANNNFGSPLMYFDDFLLIETEMQQVELKTGWNIMSFGVIPLNTDMMDIVQPLIDTKQLKKVMDESGKTIEDWGVFGGWKSTIDDYQITEGYNINVTSPSVIEVTGIPAQFPFYIPLQKGWNIISWPSPNEQDGMDVFQSLIAREDLKKVMDESGNTIENWGIYGDWKNSIGNMKPGEGYKVNVINDCILMINKTGTKSVEIIPELMPSAHFIPVYMGNGTNHMNINIVNLAESGIMEGDEIGVFDGEICVGSARITNNQLSFDNKNSVAIPVSANDGLTLKNGFTAGNKITMKLFREQTEYPLTFISLMNGKTSFEKGSSLFAKGNADFSTNVQSTIKNVYFEVYPNPFNDKLYFGFVSDRNANAVLEIFNTTGQSITRLLNRRIEEGTMNRVEYAPTNIISGVYIYKLTIDGNTSVGRVIYRK